MREVDDIKQGQVKADHFEKFLSVGETEGCPKGSGWHLIITHIVL